MLPKTLRNALALVASVGFVMGAPPAMALGHPAAAAAAGKTVGPVVFVNDVTVLEPVAPGETTHADFTIGLAGPATRPVYIAYQTRAGSARSGSDFIATSGMVGIRHGATTAHVSVVVRGARRLEHSEKFRLHITSVRGASIAKRNGIATINPPYAITVGQASVVEPPAGTYGAAQVTASLGAPMKVPVTFGWHTAVPPASDDPATPGQDYLPRQAFATIPAGQTSVALDVFTKGDPSAEGAETIAVKVDPRTTSVPVLQNGDITILDSSTTLPQPPPTTVPTTSTTTTTTVAPTAVPPTAVPPTAVPPTTVPPTTVPPITVPPITVPPTTVPATVPPPTTSSSTTVAPTTTPPATAPAPVPGPQTTNLADFINLPGDQAVVVPNGVYRARDVDAPHPATTGRFKGWLVLVAQSQGGAVVDLSQAPLTLGAGTSRVMFVGFRFVNGSVFVSGHDIVFWYTDHTFPANVWAGQSPNPGAPEQGLYRAPRTVYVNGGSGVRFLGASLHDTGTALAFANASDVLLEGVNVWGLDDLGLDPHDVVHPDAIGAVAGNNDGVTVADSWIRGRILLEDSNGSSGGPQRNLRFDRMWVSNSPSAGFTFTSLLPAGRGGIFGERTDVRSWDHKNGYDRIDIVDGAQYHDPNTQPARIDVKDTNISTTAPPAGAPSPADVWSRAHPYDSWPEVVSFLG